MKKPSNLLEGSIRMALAIEGSNFTCSNSVIPFLNSKISGSHTISIFACGKAVSKAWRTHSFSSGAMVHVE
jgi:hypothetical protein